MPENDDEKLLEPTYHPYHRFSPSMWQLLLGKPARLFWPAFFVAALSMNMYSGHIWCNFPSPTYQLAKISCLLLCVARYGKMLIAITGVVYLNLCANPSLREQPPPAQAQAHASSVNQGRWCFLAECATGITRGTADGNEHMD